MTRSRGLTAPPSELAATVESRIRRFAGLCRRLVVYWSGGKDSTAALLAARRALGYDVPAVFSMVPGQSDMAQIARLARALGYRLKPVPRSRGAKVEPEPGAIHVVSAAADFWSEVARRGPPVEIPGRRKRWCCMLFKTLPSRAVRHDCAVSAHKYRDSAWRRRLYARLDPCLPAERRGGLLVLAPLYDLSDGDVWMLLDYYDPAAAAVLRSWYLRHPSSPDCRLCLVVTPRRLRAMADAAPAGLVERALRALEEAEPRLRDGTLTKKRARQYIEALKRSLEERVGGGG